MTDIRIQSHKIVYSQTNKTFYGSEKNIRFDTSYNLINGESGKSMKFDFNHSTGPEFDPNTAWIYKSKEGYYLRIVNDLEMTKYHAANYLKHKLNL